MLSRDLVFFGWVLLLFDVRELILYDPVCVCVCYTFNDKNDMYYHIQHTATDLLEMWKVGSSVTFGRKRCCSCTRKSKHVQPQNVVNCIRSVFYYNQPEDKMVLPGNLGPSDVFISIHAFQFSHTCTFKEGRCAFNGRSIMSEAHFGGEQPFT